MSQICEIGNFNEAQGFCLGVDEEIIVADTYKHCIQIFSKTGDLQHTFGEEGEGKLWFPHKIAFIRSSSELVVYDRGAENHRARLQIFNKSGHFVRNISINYIEMIFSLNINDQNEIVALSNRSVFRISKEGKLIMCFNCLNHVEQPSDMATHDRQYYVSDFKGHCVAVFSEKGNFLGRIGGENITNFPKVIGINDQGYVFIGNTNRKIFSVSIFFKYNKLGEFYLPNVNVTRCCGLKLNKEFKMLTLVNKNHILLLSLF